jgi:opacity protein-like surface antigen
MNMKIISPRIFVAVTCFALALPSAVQAQENEPETFKAQWYGSATYDMAIPLGNTSDFGGGFSPRGFGLDFQYLFNPNWSLGLATGWQVFDHKTTEAADFRDGNVTIQGTQHRYLNAIPLLVAGHYYVRNWLPEWCLPFAGFGLGTYWAERRVDIGLYTINDSAWHFGIAPEVGIGFRVGHTLPILRVRYNHPFSSGGSGDLPYLNISVGLAWN